MEEKKRLPIKTKIAAIIIILGGIMRIMEALSGIIWLSEFEFHLLSFLMKGYQKAFIITFLIFILPAIFLLRRKKWAWWILIFTTILSLIESVAGLIRQLHPISISIIISILISIFVIFSLLLDREEFFKIAD
jgi:hypothetical protein